MKSRETSLFSLILFCAIGAAIAGTARAEGEQKFANLHQCGLKSGETIEQCQIGYRTFGQLNSQRSNAILFPTWFTGTSKDLNALVGPQKMLDPSHYFIVLIDALGDGISSSPSNSKRQPRMKFPKFTIEDMVAAEYRVATETLGLKHVHAVMGISMGGMQTFEWLVSHPDFMDIAIPIVGSPQLTATDLLLWTAEMHAIEENTLWKRGNYTGHPELRTVADIHEYALTTPEYHARHTSRAAFAKYVAEAEANVQFDWNDWHRQLSAMMSQDVARANGSLEETARQVKARVLVVVNQHDHMVNPLPALEFARAGGHKSLVLHSDCGHLATGCEAETINTAVREFLSKP